jgi:hypothetical protein
MPDVVTVGKQTTSDQGEIDIDKTKLQDQITFRKCMLLFGPDIFALRLLSDNTHKNMQ